MNVITSGNISRIYDDGISINCLLSSGFYDVSFSDISGFYLKKRKAFEISDEKIYGNHINKVNKVMNSFNAFDRNLGIILSGDKGIGKSLFARLVCLEAVKNDKPVIIVDKFIPGIDNFIQSIEQEVVILFDEFDKTFAKSKSDDTDEHSPQAGLLSLFDGVSVGKKMFIITCNEICSLNDYLLNRPGRFHYHFRFSYPSPDEIRVYLKDKLDEKYWGEIEDVIIFSARVPLNYDCLRSIVFEIKSGEKFNDAVKDLNIVNMQDIEYSVVAEFNNKEIYHSNNVNMDLFNTSNRSIQLYSKSNEMDRITVSFMSDKIKYDAASCSSYINGEDVILDGFDMQLNYSSTVEDEHFDLLKKSGVKKLTIVRKQLDSLHYSL